MPQLKRIHNQELTESKLFNIVTYREATNGLDHFD